MPDWKPMETAPKDRPIAIVAVSMDQILDGRHANVVPEFVDVEGGGAAVSIDICQWRGECFVLGWGWDTRVGHGNARAWCEVHELNLRGLLPAHALGKTV